MLYASAAPVAAERRGRIASSSGLSIIPKKTLKRAEWLAEPWSLANHSVHRLVALSNVNRTWSKAYIAERSYDLNRLHLPRRTTMRGSPAQPEAKEDQGAAKGNRINAQQPQQ